MSLLVETKMKGTPGGRHSMCKARVCGVEREPGPLTGAHTGALLIAQEAERGSKTRTGQST